MATYWSAKNVSLTLVTGVVALPLAYMLHYFSLKYILKTGNDAFANNPHIKLPDMGIALLPDWSFLQKYNNPITFFCMALVAVLVVRCIATRRLDILNLCLLLLAIAIAIKSVTMALTVYPTPKPKACPRVYINFDKNCYDYMPSAHVMVTALLIFFVAPLLPWSYPLYCIIPCAMLLTIANHSHYSSDVFIAFFIALFLYLSRHHITKLLPKTQKPSFLSSKSLSSPSFSKN